MAVSAIIIAVVSVVIWRRNRFQGTGSKVPEPVPKSGTRNRFLNIVSLTHCIICVLYESLFVNNESRNIGLKLMRLSFHFFIHSFIHSTALVHYSQCAVVLLKGSLGDCWNKLWMFCVILETQQGDMWHFTSVRRLYFAGVCLSVCLFVRKISKKLLRRFDENLHVGRLHCKNWLL